MSDSEITEGLKMLKDSCSMDPIKDVKNVIIGMNSDMDEKKMVILIQGDYDEPKITKCLVALAKAEGGMELTAKTDGKITEYSGGGKTIYIGWASKDTIVFTQGAVEGDKTFLASVLEGKSSAKNNKDLAGLMGNVDTSNTLWLAMVVTGKLKEQIGSSPDEPQPTAIWMNIDYQKALKAEIGARFANEKDAKAAVDKANKELEGSKSDPMMGAYLKTLKTEAKGNDAIFSISLDEKQVDELMAQVGQMLPMLMMGLGGGM
jgi:hypothetical protein